MWKFNVSKQYWCLDDISEYTPVNTLDQVLTAIAPFLVEAGQYYNVRSQSRRFYSLFYPFYSKKWGCISTKCY